MGNTEFPEFLQHDGALSYTDLISMVLLFFPRANTIRGAENVDGPPAMELIMDLVLFTSLALVLLWISAIAVFSKRPQARLARAALASAGVVAGTWASSASAGMTEVGHVSLVLTLLRTFG